MEATNVKKCSKRATYVKLITGGLRVTDNEFAFRFPKFFDSRCRISDGGSKMKSANVIKH